MPAASYGYRGRHPSQGTQMFHSEEVYQTRDVTPAQADLCNRDPTVEQPSTMTSRKPRHPLQSLSPSLIMILGSVLISTLGRDAHVGLAGNTSRRNTCSIKSVIELFTRLCVPSSA